MKPGKVHFNMLLFFFTAVLFSGCAEDPQEEPTAPIFSDVEEIYIYQDATTLFFDTPKEVEYLVLGIFTTTPQTIGKTLIDTNLEGGSRTGLSNFGRSSVSENAVFTYSPALRNFTAIPYIGASKLWAVWGYDKYGNLTHSSGTLTHSFP